MAAYSQAYTFKRRILIQVLIPSPNAYTKSDDGYIHFAKSFCSLLMNVCNTVYALSV